MRNAAILLITFLCICGFNTRVHGRTWTDLHGRTLNATFVRMNGGNVVLMSGNTPLQLPFHRLSDVDQQYLRDMLEAEGKGHLLPPVPIADTDEFSEDRPSPERSWGDLAGHHIRGRLVRVEGNWVYLLVGDDIFPYPLDGFRPRDRNYIQAWLNRKANTRGSLVRGQMTQQAQEEAKEQAEAAQRKRDEENRLEAERKRREKDRLAAERNQLRREERERQFALRSERKAWKRFQTTSNAPIPELIVSNCNRSCSNCQHPIPDYAQSGERCPGCGMVWDAEYDGFGKPIPSKKTALWIVVGVLCVGILLCVLAIWVISLVLQGIRRLARRV